jgi:hypothetical protein
MLCVRPKASYCNVLDPDRYFTNDLDFLKTRLIDVVTQLASLYRLRHEHMVDERKARFHAYGVYQPGPHIRDSQASRDRYADAMSQTEWSAVSEIDYQIQDYTEEKALLLLLIEWQISGIR